MSIIAFLPARGGSKSIPLKNIKLFNGQPLIYWNLVALQNCEAVNEIIVSTDHDEIEKTVLGFNFAKVKIYRRSARHAQDTSSTESTMIEYIEAKALPKSTLFILTQVTSPLTKTEHFTEAIAQYKSTGAHSLLTASRTKRFYWNADGTPINYDYKNRPRRQDFDGYLMENGAFYINTVGNIIEYRNRLSGDITVYEMPAYTGLELDEPADWVVGEALMRGMAKT